MLPSELTANDFRVYPDGARAVAVEYLSVISALPLVLAVSMLREISVYDWLFPAEQKLITGQLNHLKLLSAEKRQEAVADSAALSVPKQLSDMDWVNGSRRFLESLTAYLWASHQIDQFHSAAAKYASMVRTDPPPKVDGVPRTTIVLLGESLEKKGYPVFQKLRPQGVFFENVTLDAGSTSEWMRRRAEKAPEPLTHFYLDGSDARGQNYNGFESISWAEAAPLREDLLRRLQHMITTPGAGPEMARTQLASLSPADLGLKRTGKNAVMDHFVVSVLTEGSGTQIFSTTFVQWAARELLRRAQPATLVLHYGVRQQLQPMNDMLSRSVPMASPDAAGSFIDADMGAYYTWINMQRLSGSEQSRFVALSESRHQAVAIGPGFAKGATMSDPMQGNKLLSLLS